MTYIPGQPGMRQHPLHNHCYHPVGHPATADTRSPAPAPVEAAPLLPDFDSDDATDVPFLRMDQSANPSSSPAGGGGGSSFIRTPSPFMRSGFMPTFRRPEGAAQDFSDSNMNRYAKPSPKKEGKKSPKFLLQEEEVIESSEPAYDSLAQRIRLASQESVVQEREEQPAEEEPPMLLDPVLASFLEAVPFPYKGTLARRLGTAPGSLVERCLVAGARAQFVTSGEGAYCIQSRRLSYRNSDLESDYAVLRTLAQAVDHTVGGDGLASRRALAVLAALPGPGWKPEDFFSQELARYLLGQRGGPLESYLTYLLASPSAA